MRFTNRLNAQHLGWIFKKHWNVQGIRTPNDTGAACELKKLGKKVNGIQDLMKPGTTKNPIELAGNLEEQNTCDLNDTYRWCYVYGKEDFLLEGMKQAQILTNSVEITTLPRNIDVLFLNQKMPSSVDRRIQQIILASSALDAEQLKLPAKRATVRPKQNAAREYGALQHRQSRLLVDRLLLECEKLDDRPWRQHLLDQVDLNVTLCKNEDLLQFRVSEKIVVSLKSLEPVKGVYQGDIPNMHPVKCTVSLSKKKISTIEPNRPLSEKFFNGHPHTIFSFFNKEAVSNIHCTDVTIDQFESRTLINAFVTAATEAKQMYGEYYQEPLPRPIVIQSVHTDGRKFHFGVFQLNTLDLDRKQSINNYWFHKGSIDLFANCFYKFGRPYMDGYNKNVFRYLNAFYNNK